MTKPRRDRRVPLPFASEGLLHRLKEVRDEIDARSLPILHTYQAAHHAIGQ